MKSKAIVGGIIALIIIITAIIFCFWASKKINEKLSEINPNQPQQSPPPPDNAPPIPNNPNEASKIYLALGNPSNASANPADGNNFLLENQFYTVSFNLSKNIPNWTAWRLTNTDFGKADRQNDFRPNSDLPIGWARITPSDYTNSGYDRGHLCPSADRSASTQANSATFLMTNMTPQFHSLNAGPWEKLETYSRSLARRSTTLDIVAGQYGESGKIKNKVTIPTNFWKIIVVLPDNSNISSINADTRVIAVDMPNTRGIDGAAWRDYRTSVRQIEQKTGYKFFTALSPELQNALKNKVDTR